VTLEPLCCEHTAAYCSLVHLEIHLLVLLFTPSLLDHSGTRGVVLFSRHRLKPSVEQAAEDNLLNIYTRASSIKKRIQTTIFLIAI
jgi:hypothetical protein